MSELQGIIPRAAAEFFSCINQADSEKEKIVVSALKNHIF